jgi:5-(carboxyamino)imidazole ribonucleotide synthase
MPHTTPAATIGVVGGGQLGRMLGEAAGPLGVEVVASDPTPDSPAAPVVRDQVVGDFDDEAAIRELAERADVLTFEIELADPDAMERVGAATGTPIHPDPDTLRTIQDKLVQNRALADAGIPIPAFRGVDTAAELRAAGDELGWPLMLKAREGGYDGRGNFPVDGPGDAEAAIAETGPALAEELVDFERELAVIGVKGAAEQSSASQRTGSDNADGVRAFPVTETVHEEEILRELVTPARTAPAVRRRAREVALDVLETLDGRGVYGIELFETRDGEILVNEIAPRPHNSGHWTIEGAHSSQFEQHARAVLGWPLGAAERRAPSVTTNILGDVDDPGPAALSGVEAVLATPEASLHWYGKREVRPLRKMGHVTLSDAESDARTLLERARALCADLTFQQPD